MNKTRYTVMVDDNFHYMDEDHRHKYGEFSTYEKAVELSDGVAEVKAGLGHAFGVAGREAEARQVLHELHNLARQWHVPPVQVAFVHVSLGEKDAAFQWLDKALEQRSWELAFLQVEPWLDDLRGDPRFGRLLERMAFPDSP